MHLAEMSPLLFLTDRKVLPNKKALRAGSLCGAVEACCNAAQPRQFLELTNLHKSGSVYRMTA